MAGSGSEAAVATEPAFAPAAQCRSRPGRSLAGQVFGDLHPGLGVAPWLLRVSDAGVHRFDFAAVQPQAHLDRRG